MGHREGERLPLIERLRDSGVNLRDLLVRPVGEEGTGIEFRDFFADEGWEGLRALQEGEYEIAEGDDADSLVEDSEFSQEGWGRLSEQYGLGYVAEQQRTDTRVVLEPDDELRGIIRAYTEIITGGGLINAMVNEQADRGLENRSDADRAVPGGGRPVGSDAWADRLGRN